MGKKQRKNDVIFIGGMLFAALLLFFGMKIYQNQTTKDGGVVVVTVDGEIYGTYQLSKEREEKIVMEDGSYNLLVIRNGKADVTDASCKDKVCVNHRPIYKNGESIVCLPNKMVAGIENGEESEVDSLTN